MIRFIQTPQNAVVKFFAFSFLFTSAFVQADGIDIPKTCSAIPSHVCVGDENYCGELIPFLPEKGYGYWNYPLNGETQQNQFRSFARRDLVLLIKYAAGWTQCLTESWKNGNGQPLGLGDMSEGNGDIPGTSQGAPGHPRGTHTRGFDMDIAYYQTGTSDNRLRAVCDHWDKSGADVFHCTTDPYKLDIMRTALFLGKIHDSSKLRVIGVDGKIGPLVEEATEKLCNQKVLHGTVCETGRLRLAYETQNQQRGWYRFHHHHLHVSLSRVSPDQETMDNLWFQPETMNLIPFLKNSF
jgi:hypothetical protein